ncbi:MAG: phenylalanine--tRNA ligase subunit beta, partial [Phycisphaerales bacterium]|nr:phenylalanine--tRNA ligase subunit beta [Phycisphaerales bacterium]
MKGLRSACSEPSGSTTYFDCRSCTASMGGALRPRSTVASIEKSAGKRSSASAGLSAGAGSPSSVPTRSSGAGPGAVHAASARSVAAAARRAARARRERIGKRSPAKSVTGKARCYPSPFRMRTSVTWLNDYLDRPASAEEQATLLTAAGLNFDGGDVADNGEPWQEIETTSNRGDCLCHVGLARELCAMSGRRLKPPAAAPRATGGPAAKAVAVRNHDPAACPRYVARVITGVKVGPSPEWLQRRLRAIGQIPRNNLVDCTNFVLFELGHPTHVFDLGTLRGKAIEIRRARKDERFLPIGEGAQELTLAGGELVIADAERPVAIAGVKGGAATAVTAGTTDVLLEIAAFDPVAVRASSRGLRLSSDSSYRFERGVHPAELDAAADRLAALVLETAGGTLLDGAVEAGAPLPPARTVRVRPARVASLLGTPIPVEEVVRALDTLGFSPVPRGDAIDCTVPPRRIDVEREIDLIEEVCRIHGLDRVPMRETLAVRVAPVEPQVSAPRALKSLLVGLGFVESVTHTLVSERSAAPFLRPGEHALRVGDERAGGTPVLRPSVLASLLEVRRRNADAGIAGLRLFEFARRFALRADG